MATYLIGYDLNKEGSNYSKKNEKFRAAIEAEADGYWRNLDSTWIINSSKTAEALRDALMIHLDANDELLVITVSAPAAWYGFSDSASKWLQTHL